MGYRLLISITIETKDFNLRKNYFSCRDCHYETILPSRSSCCPTHFCSLERSLSMIDCGCSILHADGKRLGLKNTPRPCSTRTCPAPNHQRHDDTVRLDPPRLTTQRPPADFSPRAPAGSGLVIQASKRISPPSAMILARPRAPSSSPAGMCRYAAWPHRRSLGRSSLHELLQYLPAQMVGVLDHE